MIASARARLAGGNFSSASRVRLESLVGSMLVSVSLYWVGSLGPDDDQVVVAQILENKSESYGYDAATGEYGDLYKLGIIDPTKVARTALLNAASVSGLALTTDVILTELKEKKGEEATPVSGAVV